MFVKVARRGLIGPSEAVLPTMVPDGCGTAWAAAAAAWGCPARAVVACVQEPNVFWCQVRVRRSFEEGLAAVLRGVASVDDLRPSA